MRKKNLQQVHGKVEAENDIEINSLDQLWGSTGKGKYGTIDAEEYAGNLQSLNKSDLQRHAAQFGIVPIDNRERLEKTLNAEFKRYVAGFRKPKMPKNTNQGLPSQRVLDILKVGR